MEFNMEEIIQDIRNLRDADYHVCPNDTDNTLKCTCEYFDQVIDKLQAMKNATPSKYLDLIVKAN